MQHRHQTFHQPRVRYLALTLAAGLALAGGSFWTLNASAEEGEVVVAPPVPTSTVPTSTAPTSTAPTSAAPTSAAPTSRVRGKEVDDVAAWATSHWKEPGYGQVSLDYSTSTVRILWNGKAPADVTAREGLGKDGVTVEVARCQYSETELTNAGMKVMDRYRGTVVSSQPNDDLDGIVITFDPAVAKSRGQIIDADELSEEAGMSVTLEEGEQWEDAPFPFPFP